MQDLSVLRDAEQVKLAIDSAREFAESKGVSITLERLAVCLGVGSQKIKELIHEDEEELDDALCATQALLRMACEEIAASHIEHGMVRGNNTSMDLLMLKTHFGYSEKGDPAARNTTVVFFGEEDLPE